jgi:hypothetical protein
MPLIGGGRAIFAVVEASNVADGAILAATKDVALGRPYNLANDFDIAVAEFFRLAAEGLGTRVRFVPVPRALAVALLRAAKTTARLLTAGRMSVVSQVSVDFVSRDNPFTSDRARYELGWSPTVRPSEAVPSAFRWWRSHHRVRGKHQGATASRPDVCGCDALRLLDQAFRDGILMERVRHLLHHDGIHLGCIRGGRRRRGRSHGGRCGVRLCFITLRTCSNREHSSDEGQTLHDKSPENGSK